MKPGYIIAPLFIITFIFTSLFILPAYCNRIQSGSTIDLSSGSITTSSYDRFTQDFSTSNPVELRYSINIQGISGGLPGQGSGSAYMNGIIQEGSCNTMNSSLGERTEFRESTRVNGAITRFEKMMEFRSFFLIR
jgi:hypothetical protein